MNAAENGPFLSKEEAEVLEREQGWKMVEDSGRGWPEMRWLGDRRAKANSVRSRLMTVSISHRSLAVTPGIA